MAPGQLSVQLTERDGTVPAGPFAAWLSAMRAAIHGSADADVPCGTCTACCRSSQFVVVEADEVVARAAIPADVLFPAPRSPTGTMLLGYDEHGHCPMLGEHGCTIYEHRPSACRTYDCRVYPAAGIPADDDKSDLAARAARWRFDHPTDDDVRQHEAVRAAARYIGAHPEALPGARPPVNATHHAVMAVEASGLFAGDVGGAEPTAGDVRVALSERMARRPRTTSRSGT